MASPELSAIQVVVFPFNGKPIPDSFRLPLGPFIKANSLASERNLESLDGGFAELAALGHR
jgi:hypothetical protein